MKRIKDKRIQSLLIKLVKMKRFKTRMYNTLILFHLARGLQSRRGKLLERAGTINLTTEVRREEIKVPEKRLLTIFIPRRWGFWNVTI